MKGAVEGDGRIGEREVNKEVNEGFRCPIERREIVSDTGTHLLLHAREGGVLLLHDLVSKPLLGARNPPQ
jgi:hypothetical protein